MKFNLNINSYQVKTAKTGHQIPVINGVHLHSAYNPIKESEAIISKHDEMLNQKNAILVLGLGFGYHVDEIEFRLNRYHSKNYQIAVIEPNEKTIEDYQSLFPEKVLRIFCEHDLDKLYSNEDFINFLSMKPGVIPHTATFNLYTEYFKNFMSYKADNSIGSIAKNISNTGIKKMISKYPEAISYEEMISKIENKSGVHFESEEFILLAFEQLIQKGKIKSPSTNI
jgi:hypothetical protein